MDKKINWILVVFSIIILTQITGTLFNLWGIGTSPPYGHVYYTIDRDQGNWEVTIDRITIGRRSFTSIPHEDMVLWFDLVASSEDHYSTARIPLSNIKGTWSDEYECSRRVNEDEWDITTLIMNPIIWYDTDNNGELSVGDIIIIDKEGGVDGRLLPGDVISIGGRVESVSFPFSSRYKLPNYDAHPPLFIGQYSATV